MTTPFGYGGPANLIPAQSFQMVDISAADHTFSGVRPRSLYVNNPGTSLQTLVVRGESDSADASFVCGPGGNPLSISPQIIRTHGTLTVVALS